MITHPRTLEDAKKYRYFQWGGNPDGTPYDATQCAEEVWAQGRGINAYQCLRKPGHGPGKLYCKQHAKRLAGRVG